MAFKGNVFRIPPERRPKWWKRKPVQVEENKVFIHLGKGRSLSFDNAEDLRQFAITRGWRPK